MKLKSKYSDSYYKNILLEASVYVMLLSFVLLLFFTWQTIAGNSRRRMANLESENAKSYALVDEMLENTERITMFFALYKDLSPLFTAETDIDIRKAMLQEEAKTFIACFDYIANIEVTTPETTVNCGDSMTDVTFEQIDLLTPFTLYTTDENSYPQLLKLEYTTSNFDTFSANVTLYSKYLCQHYMSENSYLLTQEGHILLAQDFSLVGKHISEISTVDFDAIAGNSSAKGYFNVQQRLTEDGLILATFVPKSVSYGEVLRQILLLLLMYSFIVAMGIMVLYLLLGNLYRPIKDVAQVLKYYMPDNDVLMESDALFIKKCAKRQETSQDIDAALLQIRKSQLQILHSQISPHLLGNTLEAIKWDIIKKLGKGTKLEQSITTLSYYLTESYQYQKMITSIRDEISRTKYYTDMMTYCFYERLSIDWKISPDVEDCSIISMTLQPFIENSITHAFRRKDPNPRITVQMNSVEDEIQILIYDNGHGISKERLNSIKKSLKSEEYSNQHIGIKNSHLKLKLLFGDEYGVTNIESDENGTRVKIVIPKHETPYLS